MQTGGGSRLAGGASTAFLGLGTNVGDRARNLRTALRELAGTVRVDAVSPVYETEPVGAVEQPDFWNLVVRIRTELEPRGLLRELQAIEARMGRRRTVHGGPRVIDLDLLLYEDRRIDAPDLEVPHPRMLQRAFVLRPLADLDPDRPHPRTGRRIRDHLAEAADRLERARPLFDGTELLKDQND